MKRNSYEWQLLRDRLVFDWQQAKLALTKAQADESRLRGEIVSLLWNANVSEGTERYPVAGGMEAKITKRLNYKFSSLGAVRAALASIAETGDEGVLIALRLVSWKADLVVGEYRKLGDVPKGEVYKGIIDPVISSSPATPTLEIVKPKQA